MDKLNRTRLSNAYGIDQETLDAIRKTLDENTLYGLDDDQLAQAIVYAQMYDAPVEKAIALIDYLQDMDPPVIGTEAADKYIPRFLQRKIAD